MKTICENTNLKENLKLLKDNGYKYIIKAHDKIMSNWDCNNNKKHIQLIAVKTQEEKELIMNGLKHDINEFARIDWQYIDNYTAIKRYTIGKTYTIRNEWTKYNKGDE